MMINVSERGLLFGCLDQIVSETLPTLSKLKEAGKIRFTEITSLPLGIFNYVLDRVPPGTVDVILSYCHYSINDSTLEGLLPYLNCKGVGVINASPLSMGFFQRLALLSGIQHLLKSRCHNACQAAAAHSKAKGKNMSKLALQYSLSNKAISTTL
ncbi:NADP-dependent oxidoreductase domain, partial [Dillenia turbinata]